MASGFSRRPLQLLRASRLLKPDGVIIVQREEREPQVAPPDGLALVRTQELWPHGVRLLCSKALLTSNLFKKLKFLLDDDHAIIYSTQHC